MNMTKEEIKKTITTILKKHKDWGKPTSVEYKTTAILLASAFVGGFGDKIANILGYNKKFVKGIEKEAKKNGIWKKDGRISVEWTDKKAGGIALACDTAVCMGWLKRTKQKAKKVITK